MSWDLKRCIVSNPWSGHGLDPKEGEDSRQMVIDLLDVEDVAV